MNDSFGSLIRRLLLAAGLLAGLGGCRPEQVQPVRQPPLVVSAVAESGPLTVYLYYNGSVREIERVEVRARVAGYLEQVLLRPSSNVEAGDLLFVIEQEPYRVAVAQAEATVAAAEAELELAKITLRRTQDAYDQSAASQTELDIDKTTAAQREAQLRAAQAALDNSRIQLGYTEVRAPISGRVSEAYVDRGNLVGVEGPTLLTTIVQVDPIHAYFEASEQVALRYLSRGQDGSDTSDFPEAYLQLADESDFPHVGRVDYVDNRIDPTTGTFVVRAIFDNAARKLFPGLFARIRVPFETLSDAVMIHEEAIATDIGGKYIYVIAPDNLAERRLVRIGERLDDGRVQILSGIAAGETYIRGGLQLVRPGMPVRARAAADGSSAAGS